MYAIELLVEYEPNVAYYPLLTNGQYTIAVPNGK